MCCSCSHLFSSRAYLLQVLLYMAASSSALQRDPWSTPFDKCRPWQECDKLMLDVGGCLSTFQEDTYKTWEAVDHGAYAFLVFYTVMFGGQNLFVTTRTNKGVVTHPGGKDAWVTNFIKDFGIFDMDIPSKNFNVCKTYRQKARIANKLGIRMVVDDTEKVLQMVHELMPTCLLMLYSNDKEGPRMAPEDIFELGESKSFQKQKWYMQSWEDLAIMLGIPGVNEEFWQEVSARGPPNMPHSRDTVVAAYQALKPLSAQALYRGRPTMPVDEDDNDDDIEQPPKAKPRLKPTSKARPPALLVSKARSSQPPGRPRQLAKPPPPVHHNDIPPWRQHVGLELGPPPAAHGPPPGLDQPLDGPPMQIVPIDAPPRQPAIAIANGSQQLASMAPQIGQIDMQNIISSTVTSAIMAVSNMSRMQAVPPPQLALSNSAYRWQYKQETEWHAQKRRRASEWQARRAQEQAQGLPYGALDPKVTVDAGPLCESCGQNQPNIRCAFRCCSLCCPRQLGDRQCLVHIY